MMCGVNRHHYSTGAECTDKLGGTKTEDRALRRRNSSADFGAGMRRKSGWFPPVYILAQSENLGGVGAEPHLTTVLSELLLGSQLQVDPVIGVTDPLDRLVVKSFDVFKQRSPMRSLAPDLPRCTTIQRAVNSKLVVMRLPIIQLVRQILGR
jgi:hypothetical protein